MRDGQHKLDGSEILKPLPQSSIGQPSRSMPEPHALLPSILPFDNLGKGWVANKQPFLGLDAQHVVSPHLFRCLAVAGAWGVLLALFRLLGLLVVKGWGICRTLSRFALFLLLLLFLSPRGGLQSVVVTQVLSC